MNKKQAKIIINKDCIVQSKIITNRYCQIKNLALTLQEIKLIYF